MHILSSHKDVKGKLQITLEIAPDEAESFLEKEENLAKLLNEVGCLATAEILKNTDVLKQHIALENQRYYHKSVQKKSTNAPTAPLK